VRGFFFRKGNKMPKKKKATVKEKPRFYKSYDMKWLKKDAGEAHPDYYLVAEYEALFGEIN